eukprot:jgi/Botrbrau1/14980/Bobra.0018s0080.1
MLSTPSLHIYQNTCVTSQFVREGLKGSNTGRTIRRHRCQRKATYGRVCSSMAPLSPEKNGVKDPHHHQLSSVQAKYGASTADRSAALYDYLIAHSVRPNEHLEAIQRAQLQHPRAGMASPPDSVAILQMMVYLTRAKKVIEVGVFAGYTALGFALALPEDGKVIACDVEEAFAEMGKPHWKAAGVDHKIDLRIAPAVETMDTLLKEGEGGTFDIVFIDADKENYLNYYERGLELLRPGGLIIIDNVLWFGKVLEKEAPDSMTRAIQDVNEHVIADSRVHVCMLKNSDGITLAFKK